MAGNALHPKTIIWDGEPHRFPGRDRQRGDNGWYVAFPDRRGAVYGDWREAEVKHHWQADGDQVLSREELQSARQVARAQFEAQRRQREEKRKERQSVAATECETIFDTATHPVPRDFGYLARKELPKAPGARLVEKNGDRFIIVPLYDTNANKLQSLQWIAADGTKRYHPGARVKGCCFEVGGESYERSSRKKLYICEGWATAIAIQLATKCAVVIAFSAGNLKRIAVHFRRKYPEATVIICADNDRYSANGKGKHNPGVTAARVALKAAREAVPGAETHIAVPDFESLDGNPTDFDDLRRLEGLQAVRARLEPGAKEAETRAPPPANKLHLSGSNAEDLRHAFGHFGIGARYDLRGKDVQFRLSEPPGDYAADSWIEPDDRLEAALQERICTGSVNISTRKAPNFIRPWARLVNAIVAEHQVDPFKEYLDSIPPWDGKKRLSPLLCDLFKAEGDALVRWAGAYIFLAVIQRTSQPGCKLREIPVLIGPQGCGKSALLRNIFPREHRDTWYGGELDLSASPKRRVEALLRRALVELSEMAGANRAEIGKLKSFLTLEDDGSIRLSYDRRPSNLPRRCAFVGTSNDPQCLPADKTGSTRFVAITLTDGSAIEAFLDKEVTVDDLGHPCTVREQLWAEALALYCDGTRANLPRDLYPRQAEVNLAATTRPEELENEVLQLDPLRRFTYRQVAKELELVPIRADGTADYSQLGRQRNGIRAAMLAAGWVFKRLRVEGKPTWVWVYPDAASQ